MLESTLIPETSVLPLKNWMMGVDEQPPLLVIVEADPAAITALTNANRVKTGMIMVGMG